LYDALSPKKRPRPSDLFVNLCWRYLRAPKIALKDRIFVNQCGVDNVTFSHGLKDPRSRADCAARAGLKNGARLLLYAGRISPEKNIRLLVDVMKELGQDGGRQFHMVVAGDGPALADLKAEAERRVPGSISFLGHINDKLELARFYANADAFVHTNPNEPFGIAPLEALSSGLPLIAPDSGGLLSYANSKNSWLVKPTGAAFASAIRNVFSDEAAREAKIEHGLRTSSGYSWEASTDSLFEVYDEMYSRFQAQNEMYDYRKFPKDINFAANLTVC
jgi:glycosyltransferase involved in cell wall biosynthesis